MSTTQVFIIHLIELIAAIAGSIYLSKNRIDKSSRFLVAFLWLTVVVEKVGLIKKIVDQTDYLVFLEGTIFAKPNYWIYNPYLIISIFFYVRYLSWNMGSLRNRKLLRVLSYIYVVSSIFNFCFYPNEFFISHSAYGFIVGSFLVFLTILLYFYEVLQNDIILKIKNYLPFYIATGVLFFYLTMTPFFIHSKYYSAPNPDFIKIYTFIITFANVIMYTCFTVGFIVCSKKNKSYS